MNYENLFSKPEDSTKLFSAYDFIEDLFMQYANEEISRDEVWKSLKIRFSSYSRLNPPIPEIFKYQCNNKLNRVAAKCSGKDVPTFKVYEELVKYFAKRYYKLIEERWDIEGRE